MATYIVRLTGGPTQHTQWSYFTENPQGGGSGMNADAGTPRRGAERRAIQWLPVGTEYRLIVNGRDLGTFTKGA